MQIFSGKSFLIMEKVRQSACITVDEDAKPEGEFGKMHLPGGK